MDLLIDLHAGNLRQGPGSKESFLQALNMLPLDKNQALQVADIGCGTGSSSLLLAAHTQWKIQAVDLFPKFLDLLREQAEVNGISEQIETISASMDALPFQPKSLDLIWSEGAIYNMGFEKGLAYWSRFLKPNGYVAISEICWTSEERPDEIQTYWNDNYPEIGRVEDKIQAFKLQAFEPLGYFLLPETDWLENYYLPLEASIPNFLQQQQHSADAKAIAEETKEEIALYHRFGKYFSYGFFVAQLKGSSES